MMLTRIMATSKAQDVSRAHNNEKRFLPRAQMMLTRIMATLMALSQRVSIIVTGLQILKINNKKIINKRKFNPPWLRITLLY